jgi:hypothetical protein
MKHKIRTILIVVGTLAVATVGLYVYSVRYIKTLNEKIIDVKSDADQVKSNYDHLVLLHNTVENSSDNKKQLTNYFIPAGGAVDFISSFEQTAQAVGLKFNTVSLDTEPNVDLLSQNKELLHVVFETNGSWNQTMHFLEIVESLPYAVQISSASLDGAAGSPSLVGSDSSTGVVANQKSLGYWRLLLNFKIVKIKDDAQ